MTPLLSIRNVRKYYGQVLAVEDINLDVTEGEFLTFLGPSGSGKSTLLYMIAGLEDVSAGEVMFRDTSLLAIPPHKRNIGMVFQRYTLIPHMSVEQNIAFPLRVRGWTKERIAERVDDMLKLVHLEGFGSRKPSQLSGGQQQRVALARALSYDPGILLMDEPLAALDKRLKEEIQDEIKRIHRETGVTILYVTHDQEEALRLSDRVAVFNRGRIEQLGLGHELYERPHSRFVANFVGNSNFVSCKVTGVSGGAVSVCFPDGTAIDQVESHGAIAVGADASILVRPEQLTVTLDNSSSDIHGIRGQIEEVTYLGELVEISVRTTWDDLLTARIPGNGSYALSLGADCSISWPSRHGIIFNDERIIPA